MKPLTEAEALAFYDLMMARFFGWSLVLGMVDGKTDFRRRQTKDAHGLFRDIFRARGPFLAELKALQNSEAIVELWPEEYREVVRFQIDHKVPRVENEPTSAHYAATMREGGRTDYELPDFLKDHGASAAVDDHPAWQHLLAGRAAA